MSVNLNSVNFSYGEKQNRFELSDFDINVIQGLLKEINHNKKLVYFLPKTSFSPTLIILPTILNLINDISQNKKEITSTDEWIKSYFPIGTYVKVNSRSLAIIQDHIHNKNGKLEKIKLGLKDNDSYEMPISYIWRLQKYEGNARRLNRLEGIEKGDNNAFFTLSKIFQVDNLLSPFFEPEKIVIYIGSKKVKELLEKLFLEDVPFPTLFPTKYYTEPENGMNLINDIFQREPILKLTPYLENVLTMKKQNKIHTLIIDQIKTIEGQQSLFERLLSDEKVGNILFLDWLENQEKVNLLKNYDFKVKKFYPDIINIRNRQSSSTTSYSSQNEYSYHKIYISNLQNLKHFILTPSINEITFLKEYIYYEEKIKLNLEYLGKSIYENKFLSDLNNLTYSILFHLRSAPDFYDEEFIDSYFDSLFLSIKATYEKLKDYCNKKQQVSLEKILELIVKLIYSEAFRELSLIKRMKILDICNLHVNKDKRIAIVTKRKKEVLIIQNLCSRTKHRISFFTFKEYVRDNNNIFDAILLTFYPRKSIEDLWVNGKTDTIYYFLYPDEIKLFKNVYLSELNKHSYIEKQEFKFPELIEDFKTPIDYDYEQTKDYSKESSVNSILNEQIKKNYNEEEAKRHKALYVEFIEGYYAFLTEKYHCHLINRNEEKIENRTIELLEIGDEIGFLNDPDDHLLEKYLSLKFESDNSWAENYKKISNRADYWRKKLLIYQKKNGISLENLRKELKAFGCKRTIHTIKRWFNDKKMYAPRQDAIIAIGKLLQDEKILNNVDKIIASAEKKKKLHQKIRSRIEDFAVNSVFNSNYVGNTIIRKMTDDIKKRFFQVEISYISSDYRDVPSYLINKLISN